MSRRHSTEPVEVVVTLDFPQEFVDRVRAADSRIVVHHHPVADGCALPASLLACAEVMYTSELLPGPDEAPALRWVQLDSSGIDHVRVTPLWDSEIVVTTLGGVSPAPLAEWVLMMVLAHAHRLRETERLAADRHWPTRDGRWTGLMPRDLRNSTIGIVGYGRIGHEVARLARAFGMEVLAVRRAPGVTASDQFGEMHPVDGVRETGLDQLHDMLARSDYVVLTVPLTPQTHGMIGRPEFAVFKPGSVLVNASRGGVVDEAALLEALDGDRLELAASDVFVEEPLPADSPFWSHPRFVVTPHVAGFAADYLDVVARLFTENLRRYLDGRRLLNVADRGRGY